VLPSGERARVVTRHALERGLIVETSGPQGEVVKVLCPLTIGERALLDGLGILAEGIETSLARRLRRVS